MVTLHVPLFSLSLHLITLVYVRMEDVNVSVCTKGIMHASILRVTIFFAIVHPRTKSWSMQLLNYQLPRKTHPNIQIFWCGTTIFHLWSYQQQFMVYLQKLMSQTYPLHFHFWLPAIKTCIMVFINSIKVIDNTHSYYIGCTLHRICLSTQHTQQTTIWG